MAGKEAVTFFDGKIQDPLLLANLKRAGQVPADVVLLNIDSKSDYGMGSQKDAILKVFIKVFYEMQGLYGSKPWVADMESLLVKEGKYEAFKTIIQETTGDLWENRRRRVLFDRDLYPFIPYQFNLLQKVFSGIRKHGSSGKHLAEGERSLLSAFQESAQAYREKSIGTLVPFYSFYSSIETFLDGSIRRVIDQARENIQLHPEDHDVLKIQ